MAARIRKLVILLYAAGVPMKSCRAPKMRGAVSPAAPLNEVIIENIPLAKPSALQNATGSVSSIGAHEKVTPKARE